MYFFNMFNTADKVFFTVLHYHKMCALLKAYKIGVLVLLEQLGSGYCPFVESVKVSVHTVNCKLAVQDLFYRTFF